MDRAFAELWQPLTDVDECPRSLFGEIYSGLRPFLNEPVVDYVMEADGRVRHRYARLDDLATTAISEPAIAESLLLDISQHDFESEFAATSAISAVYDVLVDIDPDDLAGRYLGALRAFVDRYSLRYYVDAKARLWVSLAGFAAALFEQMRTRWQDNMYIRKQLDAFEHALAECLADPAETRIMTTIQKQCNLLEAIGMQHQQVQGNTLGSIVDQVGSWPHNNLRDAAKLLYGFASDYPGIRHGGTAGSDIRDLDIRDLAGVTLSLAGFTAYFAEDMGSKIGLAIQGSSVENEAASNCTAPWSEAARESSSAL